MRSVRNVTVDFPAAAVEARCNAALRYEELGEYERACELLAPVWSGPGTRPSSAGLSERVAAEVLMRAGSLTGWLGSKRQVEGWQEISKDLLSESASRFESLRDLAGWGWAQKCLALCYWREGALNEARAVILAALEQINSPDDLWISLNLVLVILEKDEGRNNEALACLRGMKSRVARCESILLKGLYHTGMENALENLGNIDGAITETTAAIDYFDTAGYVTGQVLAINNLANLYRQAGDIGAAHSELDRAERLARGTGDDLHLAHLKDTRALVYLDQRDAVRAERAAGESVAIFERGDEHAMLARSLVTRGRSLARLKDGSALGVYVRAYELAADRVGSRMAGEIAIEIVAQLAGEACLDSHMKMDDAIDTIEESIIRRALDNSASITEAAMRLGLKQQTLSLILQTRHAKLHPPDRSRRGSIVKKKS